MSNSETNLVEALRVLLADSYTLQLKTQNYHWNVTGQHFFAHIGEGRLALLLRVGVKQRPGDFGAASLGERSHLPGNKTA